LHLVIDPTYFLLHITTFSVFEYLNGMADIDLLNKKLGDRNVVTPYMYKAWYLQ